MKKIILVLIISFFSILNTNANFKEIEVKKDVNINYIECNNSGNRCAYSYYNDGAYLIENGIEYKGYNSISDLLYSKNGKHFSFLARKNNGKSVIVKDGIESKEYNKIEGNTIYSGDKIALSDNGNIAFIANKKGKQIVVENGIEGKGYIQVKDLKYNEKGELIYKASVFEGWDKNYDAYVINGVENIIDKKEKYIFNVEYKSYTDETKSTYYTYQVIREFNNKKEKIGKEYNPKLKYGNKYHPEFKIYPNGKDVVFIAKNNNKSFVLDKGIEGKKFDYIEDLIMSEDGSKIAYIGLTYDKNNSNKIKFYHIIENNKEIAKYEGNENGGFSKIIDFNYINNNLIYKNRITFDDKVKVIWKGKESEELSRILENKSGKDYSIINDNLYFFAYKNEKYILYKNLIPIKEFKENEKFNGKYTVKIINNHIIFIYNKDGKNYIIDNGIYKNGFDKKLRDIEQLSNKKGFYLLVENNGKKYIITYVFDDNKIKETKLKPIPKIDRVLNKFFAKVDKKGEVKSKALYNKIIKKIDLIISKTKSSKKKKLLEYIKVKFEEKVK